MSRLFPIRRRRQLLRAAPVLLIIALLPSLLYVDHWLSYLSGQLAVPEAATSDVEHVGHHSHCHSSPASCSDQPVPLNARGFLDLIELPELDLPAVLLVDGEHAPEEFISVPPTEPPRPL